MDTVGRRKLTDGRRDSPGGIGYVGRPNRQVFVLVFYSHNKNEGKVYIRERET